MTSLVGWMRGTLTCYNSLLPCEHKGLLVCIDMRVVFGPFFIFSNFKWSNTLQQNLCYISKSIMKHEQISYWKSHLPWFSDDYWKCMCVDFLLGYLSRPPPPKSIKLMVESRTINEFEHMVQYVLKHMPYWVPFLDLT